MVDSTKMNQDIPTGFEQEKKSEVYDVTSNYGKEVLDTLQPFFDGMNVSEEALSLSQMPIDKVAKSFVFPENDQYINMYDLGEGEAAISKLLSPVEKKYAGIEKKYLPKIVHAVNEMGTNVARNGEREVGKEKGAAFIKIYETKEIDKKMVCFETINRVNISDPKKAEEFEKFKVKIQTANQKSKDELKDLYNQQQDKAEISEKGGAGLGLLDLAKRARSIDENTSPFEYKIGTYKDINGNTLAIVRIIYKLNISESEKFGLKKEEIIDTKHQ